MPKATIYDVSQRADVSIATVSRVLNSPDQVSAKTRERVLTVIDELDFVPKSDARDRARKTIGTIGILTPSSISASFVDRLRGMIGALSAAQVKSVIYDVATEAQRNSYLAQLTLTQAVDGIIVVDMPIDRAAAKRVLKHRLPTVHVTSVVTQSPSFDLPTIVHRDSDGGRMAADYLLAQGHRTLAYVGDQTLDTFSMAGDQKLDSFRQTLAENGVALPDLRVRLRPFGMQLAYESAQELLALPTPPTAIFAGSDMQAIGVLRAVRERGLRAPDDVAVMGFDDIAVAEYIGLTTIRQQLRTSGRLAAELLLQQIADSSFKAENITLDFTLVKRDTA